MDVVLCCMTQGNVGIRVWTSVGWALIQWFWEAHMYVIGSVVFGRDLGAEVSVIIYIYTSVYSGCLC